MRKLRTEQLYITDYHIHTFRSHDGRATMSEQCTMAASMGLDEIGFAEHKDFDPNDPVVHHFDPLAYADDIAREREHFAGRLTIRHGIELDFQQWFVDELHRWLIQHPFDYVISSVHHIDGRMLMTPEYLEVYPTELEAYGAYHQAILYSVQSGALDIVGHLGYAQKRGTGLFGDFKVGTFRDQLVEIFELMMEKNIALEINTAGLYQPPMVTYPDWTMLELYYETGGRMITLGSDAHQPKRIAARMQEASLMLYHIGFREILTYEHRKPIPKPIIQ